MHRDSPCYPWRFVADGIFRITLPVFLAIHSSLFLELAKISSMRNRQYDAMSTVVHNSARFTFRPFRTLVPVPPKSFPKLLTRLLLLAQRFELCLMLFNDVDECNDIQIPCAFSALCSTLNLSSSLNSHFQHHSSLPHVLPLVLHLLIPSSSCVALPRSPT